MSKKKAANPNAMSGGSPAAKLFGKDLKIFLGGYGVELEQTPMSVGLTLDLQMPYEVAYQHKPKPPKLKGQSASYVIQDEVLSMSLDEQMALYGQGFIPFATESADDFALGGTTDADLIDKIAYEMADKQQKEKYPQ